MTVRILTGHVLDRLCELPDESVHMVCTSPPYWGLRDYGTPPQVWGGEAGCEHEWGAGLRHTGGAGVQGATSQRAGRSNVEAQEKNRDAGSFCSRCGVWCGSLGLEPTYQLYVEHIVEIMREVRRVLRSDGTLWLNMGDSYCHDRLASPMRGDYSGDDGLYQRRSDYIGGKVPKRIGNGLKPKDLMGIPWRVAFALQDDGWYLRRDIIWSKPNPMPESTNDRCTTAHEYVFLLSKSSRYFYDAEAIKEEADQPDRVRADVIGGASHRERQQHSEGSLFVGSTKRNKRSVWTIATAPFPEAHFATFPPALVEPCILAGTSARGVCPKCGAPWERVTRSKTEINQAAPQKLQKSGRVAETAQSKGRAGDVTTETIGWRPTCSCGEWRCRECANVLDTRDASTKDLPRVQDRISAEEEAECLLQSSVQQSESGPHSSNFKRNDNYEQGLSNAPRSPTSECDPGRIYDGAPARNGEGNKTPFDAGGSGASQERRSTRQPPGEFGIDDQGKARRSSKAAISRRLSSLSADISTQGKCQNCGSIIERTTPTPVPATVLDCFLGAGTTALLADRLQRNCIGIELSEKYAEMARRRIEDDAGMFLQMAAE